MSKRPILALAAFAACLTFTPAESMLVYFGTYDSESSKGIYVSMFDTEAGKLTAPELAAEIKSPSFLAIHPGKKFLFAVNESGTAQNPAGAISSFVIDAKSGKLALLNQQPTRGAGPCHVSVDHSGKVALAANYGGGSVVSVPIQPDGHLGEGGSFFQHEGRSVNPRRQDGPHAHSINVSPNGEHAFVCDLGLDKIFNYRILPNLGTLEVGQPPFVKLTAGAGPRHFAFHPGGLYAYSINELNSSITTLTYNGEKGTLTPTHTISTLPPDFSGNNSTAHVEAHPNGKWVYGSNRGHDSIALFAVDATTGWLRLIEATSCGGKTPRNFGIDPTGRWLLAANQGTNNVVVFKIDEQSGKLTPNSDPISVGKPVCVKFVAP
ncbi:MAG: lactonase family protein [Verrucomicrobiales bacterium]